MPAAFKRGAQRSEPLVVGDGPQGDLGGELGAFPELGFSPGEVGDGLVGGARLTLVLVRVERAASKDCDLLTRNVLGEDATYLRDALTALAISDPETPRRLEPGLQEVAELLRQPDKPALNAAYDRLVQVVGTVSPATCDPLTARTPTGSPASRAGYGTRGRPVPG